MAADVSQSFLIIRLSSMGDILLTTPLIRALRKKYPSSRIDFVIKMQFADCLTENHYLDNLYLFDSSSDGLCRFRKKLAYNRYDTVIDLHGNFRSLYLRQGLGANEICTFRKHKTKRYLLVHFGLNLYKNPRPVYLRYIDSVKSHGIEYDGQGLDFFISKEAQEGVRHRLEQLNFDFSPRAIALAPGASFETKRWPAERFAEIAARLQSSLDCRIVIVGGSGDTAIADQISEACPQPVVNFAGKLSIMETAAAISFCRLVVSNDSGLMHLANALKKPTLSIFGPTTRELGFFPLPELSRVIENTNIPCRPCTHMGRHKCPKKHFDCMRSISVESVYSAIVDSLEPAFP